jgi:hypothetical protein
MAMMLWVSKVEWHVHAGGTLAPLDLEGCIDEGSSPELVLILFWAVSHVGLFGVGWQSSCTIQVQYHPGGNSLGARDPSSTGR